MESEEKKKQFMDGLIKQSYTLVANEKSNEAALYLARSEITLLREIEAVKAEPVKNGQNETRLYQNAVIVYQYMATFNQL